MEEKLRAVQGFFKTAAEMQGFKVACCLLFCCYVIGYGLWFGQAYIFSELQKTCLRARNAEVRLYAFLF